MGKAGLLLALLVGVSAIPLASAAPVCAGDVARACAEPGTTSTASVDTDGSGAVPRTHSGVSGATNRVHVNQTVQGDSGRSSVDATTQGAIVCGVFFPAGTTVIQLGCVDTNSPPSIGGVPTSPTFWIEFVRGVVGPLPCTNPRGCVVPI